MRRTRALVLLAAVGAVATSTLATFAGSAGATEPEPPGTVLISTDVSSYPNIAVSPGRIVWTGLANGGQVRQRALSSDGSTVTLGSPSTIGPSGGGYWGSVHHSSSGARTLWTSKANPGSPRVRLTSGGTTQELAPSGVPLRLSGSRALYRRGGTKHYLVYDLHTRTTLDITNRYGTRMSAGNFTADLFGNNLVFLAPDFSIRLKNLSNGAAPVVVARPGVNPGVNVFTYGDWVAWDSYYGDLTGPSGHDCRMVNIRTTAPAFSVGCPWDLTSAGLVSRTYVDPSNSAWSLRRYNGEQVALPVPASTYDVEINGNVMAWADIDGLHAAPLPNPPKNRPRSLGDPVTSATYRIGGTSWPFRLVTTAPLATCHLQITQAGVLVRQLDCDDAVIGKGEVLARWDGRNSHGNRVQPGRYRWIAYASNGDGPMLRSDGVAKQTTGILTVTR